MRIDEAAAFLRENDGYLILTHSRPDGDTVGCAAALCLGLRDIGKTAWVLENPDLTPRYEPYLEGITAPADYKWDTLVAVDVASPGLLTDNAEQFKGRIALDIDHHPSNEGVAERTLLRPECAACGEIVYELLKLLCGRLSPRMAECVYLAVSTDTGCFRYSNTTAATLRIASELMELGIDAYSINKIMFGTKSLARLRLESLLIESAEFFNGGETAFMYLSPELMEKTGAQEDDTDGISGLPRAIEGVECGFMLRGEKDGSIKVSLRTAGKIDASAVCALSGGGGHRGAAGTTLEGSYAEVRDAMLDALRKVRGS